MPKGTKVESCYQKVRKQGKSKASAAKICQAATGESLKTGKPSKKKALGEDKGKLRRQERMLGKWVRDHGGVAIPAVQEEAQAQRYRRRTEGTETKRDRSGESVQPNKSIKALRAKYSKHLKKNVKSRNNSD